MSKLFTIKQSLNFSDINNQVIEYTERPSRVVRRINVSDLKRSLGGNKHGFIDSPNVVLSSTQLKPVVAQMLQLSASWLNLSADIIFILNRDYLDDRWSPEELKAVNEAEMLGLISKQTGFQIRQKMEVYPEAWSFEQEAELLAGQGVS